MLTFKTEENIVKRVFKIIDKGVKDLFLLNQEIKSSLNLENNIVNWWESYKLDSYYPKIITLKGYHNFISSFLIHGDPENTINVSLYYSTNCLYTVTILPNEIFFEDFSTFPLINTDYEPFKIIISRKPQKFMIRKMINKKLFNHIMYCKRACYFFPHKMVLLNHNLLGCFSVKSSNRGLPKNLKVYCEWYKKIVDIAGIKKEELPEVYYHYEWNLLEEIQPGIYQSKKCRLASSIVIENKKNIIGTLKFKDSLNFHSYAIWDSFHVYELFLQEIFCPGVLTFEGPPGLKISIRTGSFVGDIKYNGNSTLLTHNLTLYSGNKFKTKFTFCHLQGRALISGLISKKSKIYKTFVEDILAEKNILRLVLNFIGN